MNARVAVIMGGRSSEHEVSLRSGAQVLKAIQEDRPLPVVIGKDGRWSIDGGPPVSVGRALDQLQASCDVAFLALHGAFGEDGTIQGLFEMAGMPYTGSGVLGSALAMDKVRTKLVYRQLGIPTPDFVSITRRDWTTRRAELIAEVEGKIGFPSALKVACAGSSVGMRFPTSTASFVEGVQAIMAVSELALAERYVKGREFTCGVIELGTSEIRALPVTEIIPDAKYAFFDYEAKYTPGATREVTPAEIDAGLRDQIQAWAIRAHLALGCRDVSRTDVMVGADGLPMLLETNTIPGLTGESLLPQAARAAGISFPELVRGLVNRARSRAVSVQ
ncbi:MAG: D-alanine--D-alanine ligase [Myxococcota bacterium]